MLGATSQSYSLIRGINFSVEKQVMEQSGYFVLIIKNISKQTHTSC
jgi:hypothetical protein